MNKEERRIKSKGKEQWLVMLDDDLLRMLMRQISMAARAAVESLMIFSCFKALHRSPEYPSGHRQ